MAKDIIQNTNELLDKVQLYTQYSSIDWLREYIDVINDLIRKWYLVDFKTIFVDYQKFNFDVGKASGTYTGGSPGDFFIFWVLKYLGLDQPIGGSSKSNMYDTTVAYDSLAPDNQVWQYDTVNAASGVISDDEFSRYIKFLYNWQYTQYNTEKMMNVLTTYLNCKPNEVYIVDRSDGKVLWLIPKTDDAVTLTDLILNYPDKVGIPYGTNLDISMVVHQFTIRGSNIRELVLYYTNEDLGQSLNGESTGLEYINSAPLQARSECTDRSITVSPDNGTIDTTYLPSWEATTDKYVSIGTNPVDGVYNLSMLGTTNEVQIEADCIITVRPWQSLEILEDSVEVPLHGSYKLTVTPEDCYLSASYSNYGVATFVSETKTVLPVTLGETDITLTRMVSGVKESKTITVKVVDR